MRVKVIVAKHGYHVKGDVFVCHKSTGEALMKHKIVEKTEAKLFCKRDVDLEKARLLVAESKPKADSEKMSKEEALGLKDKKIK